MEQLAVGASADLVDHAGLKINEDGTRDVLACTSLGEEGVEGVIATTDGLVGGHLTVGLDSVLKAVELPAAVAALHTGLTKMDGQN